MTSVTASEAYLTTLARHAFLRLWSYPNPFYDKGNGKELCDLLIVFGDDIVVFSDKHCDLHRTDDLSLAWRRWYKRAVLASASQALGATKWLKQHPTRVFEDAACKQLLQLPINPGATVHRVLTIRGAAAAAQSEWGGRGSLIVTNRSLEECTGAPFRLGAFDSSGAMFHVFDENALDAVLTTLDTAADLIGYLNKREQLFRMDRPIIAASEEDVLGLYLMNHNEAKNELDFAETSATTLNVSGHHWDSWLISPQRAARDQANKVSYNWDKLIEKFSFHTMTETQEFASSKTVSEQEPLLRWFSRESRFRRRILAESLIDMIDTTLIGEIRRRFLPPAKSGDPFWVFLLFPHPDDISYEQYREIRRNLLTGHIYALKYLHPSAQDIIALAFGKNEGYMTEDAMYSDCREWSVELYEHGRIWHEQAGIFANPTSIAKKHWEYPI